MLTKASAISILEREGWIINNPDDIKVDEIRDNVIFLSQAGNGEWIITEGSVTFFGSAEEEPAEEA